MKILVVSRLDTDSWPDSREVEKLKEWFDIPYRVEHILDTTKCGPDFDLAFLVGRRVQQKYRPVNQPFWLRGKVAGIPCPRTNIKPELERMVRSFIVNVIALFECASEGLLDSLRSFDSADNK